MNVLLLMADDMNTWLLGDEGRYPGKVVAPNLRGLGESGIVFKHAYTASPACCPSRTAFFSGLSPWKTGLYQNGLNAKGCRPLLDRKSMPQLFREAGYFTASFGKITHGWNPKESWDIRLSHKRDPAPPALRSCRWAGGRTTGV